MPQPPKRHLTLAQPVRGPGVVLRVRLDSAGLGGGSPADLSKIVMRPPVEEEGRTMAYKAGFSNSLLEVLQPVLYH